MVRISVLADALNNICACGGPAEWLEIIRTMLTPYPPPANAEKTGKRQVIIRPSSKVIVRFLTVIQKKGVSLSLSVCSVYVSILTFSCDPQVISYASTDLDVLGLASIAHMLTLFYIQDEFEEIDDHRAGKIVIQLNGRINKCGVISPRFNVQLSQIENWINLLLPARSFGYIILTTSAGIMDHEEARRKHVAGKVGYLPIPNERSERERARRSKQEEAVSTNESRSCRDYVISSKVWTDFAGKVKSLHPNESRRATRHPRSLSCSFQHRKSHDGHILTDSACSLQILGFVY